MLEPWSPNVTWIVVLGFIMAFILAFGIGANDVANSFGTSVGSKVLTIKQACFLATVFEIAGAVLIGYKVSDTMRKGILDVTMYENDEIELMLGCLCALASCAAWLMLATFFKMPISGTHSIVGATVGFSLVAKGTQGLHWSTLGYIVASWFVSPVLSGTVSVILYLVIKKFILIKPNPFESGLKSLPFFYGATILINVFSILHDGPKLLYFDLIPLWGATVISLGIGLVTMIVVHFTIVPLHRKQILNDKKKESAVNFTFGESEESTPSNSPKKINRLSQIMDNAKPLTIITETTEMLPLNQQPSTGTKYMFPKAPQAIEDKNGYSSQETEIVRPSELRINISSATISGEINPALSPNSSAVPLIMDKKNALKQNDEGISAVELRESLEMKDVVEASPEVSKLFSFLQILTATFGSFAHGGNDVSNAIGPVIALWLIYTEGSVQQTSETPLYILLYGGVGISLGLWLWGRRVIQTIGEDLTRITPSTGFTIEIGAALTVLLASKIGLPISTTHCKVGSVVFVGYVSTKQGVDWSLFRNIISAWVITVPIAAVLSASCMYSLTFMST